MATVGADEVKDEREEDTYDIDGNDVQVHTSRSVTPEDTDPFSKDFEFAKSLDGLHPNAKRSMANKGNTLRKKYEGRAGTSSKKIEDDIITGYNAFEVVLPPYNLDHLAKLYELNVHHKAAIDAKTANIVGLGYDFIPAHAAKKKMDKYDGDKAQQYQRKLTDWKEDLMQHIKTLNDEDTLVEVLQKVWKDYESTGNGYIEISRSDATGEIGYVGHVPATTIRIRRKRDGFVQIIANKAVFFRNFGKDDADPFGRDANPSEIIHIKKYAPSSTFYGVPDIVAAKQAIAGNKFSADFNLDYFENKAVPRHVITLQGATINPRLAKNILEFFETGLKGKNHRSLFVPLPASSNEKKVEFKIDAVEAGIQDSSFNNYRKSNRDEILTAHRVPINKIGLPEGVSLAVARDADKTFKEQVCGPEQDILEQKVNPIFVEIQGLQHLFDFHLNELTLTDENTQSQIDERRRKTGTETANEQRTRRGQPALPGGDELFDMNAATKVAEMADKTTRRGQDKSAAAAAAKPAPGAAGANANGNPVGTRQRDTQRSAAATDSQGEGRNAKGEGRTNGTG
jgi:PBSX family phage portal protein